MCEEAWRPHFSSTSEPSPCRDAERPGSCIQHGAQHPSPQGSTSGAEPLPSLTYPTPLWLWDGPGTFLVMTMIPAIKWPASLHLYGARSCWTPAILTAMAGTIIHCAHPTEQAWVTSVTTQDYKAWDIDSPAQPCPQQPRPHGPGTPSSSRQGQAAPALCPSGPPQSRSTCQPARHTKFRHKNQK